MLVLVIASASACQRRGPARTAPVPMPGPEVGRTPAQVDATDRARRDAESIAAENALAAVRASLEAPVYFTYNGFDLDDDDRDALDEKIKVLRNNPAVRILISGHADERGSDEYNLALGQQRAAAVKEYLTQNGIDGSRLEIVSYGEEQPVCRTPGEDCWSRNRRAAFAITAGRVGVPPND
jgi:peptidoglycan-associated lipoprotein